MMNTVCGCVLLPTHPCSNEPDPRRSQGVSGRGCAASGAGEGRSAEPHLKVGRDRTMMWVMRTLSVEELGHHFASVPGKPRVVVSGNSAVPWPAVRALDENKDTYTIHVLNAPPGIPD